MTLIDCTFSSNNLMPLRILFKVQIYAIVLVNPISFSGHFLLFIKISLTFIQQTCQIKQIADYMVIEQCLSNHLILISAL